MDSMFMRLLLLLAFPHLAQAELTIFDVRKNLAMSSAEVVYRDFYINGGSESGLSSGMVLTVQRRLPLYDTYQNRSVGDLQLKVAKIKIIHVQRGLAVGRLHVEFKRDNSPLLEDPFIMIGDRLDLNSASSDKKADNSEGGESAQLPTAALPVSAPARDPVPPPVVPTPSETPAPTSAAPTQVPVEPPPTEAPANTEVETKAQIMVNRVEISALVQ